MAEKEKDPMEAIEARITGLEADVEKLRKAPASKAPKSNAGVEQAIRAIAGHIGRGAEIDAILDPDDGIRGRTPEEIKAGKS